MPEYTEEQIEEMIHEAVEKTEKSFGGTFKRLKSENEQLAAELETLTAGREEEKAEYERRIGELEGRLSDSMRRVSGLAVRGELMRQLRESGPLPERFVDIDAIEYSEDPDTLAKHVAEAVGQGRREFEAMLEAIGVAAPSQPDRPANPTNPASRDTTTARDLRKSEARTALLDMTRRGMLR